MDDVYDMSDGIEPHDPIIAALRTPALPAELAGERAIVDAMTQARGGASWYAPGRGRRAAAVATISVLALGVGGLAAAGPGFFSSPADETAATSSSTSEASASSTEASSVPSSAPTTVPETTPSTSMPEESAATTVPTGTDVPVVTDVVDGITIECEDGNHGATVSKYAQGTTPEDMKNHGQIVSAAARSDCGKDQSDDSSGDDSDDDASSTSVPADDQPGNSGNAGGSSNSSNGNGNGNSGNAGGSSNSSNGNGNGNGNSGNAGGGNGKGG
jgi:hypothetical protein